MSMAEADSLLGEQDEAAGFDPVLIDIFDGVDVGLAVFDGNLELIRANDRYHDLCGYSKESTPPGTGLRELMSLSHAAELRP